MELAPWYTPWYVPLILDDGNFENEPEHVPGKQKYRGFQTGGKGLYSEASFSQLLPQSFVKILIASANNSLRKQAIEIDQSWSGIN